jgi:hypothetical protein
MRVGLLVLRIAAFAVGAAGAADADGAAYSLAALQGQWVAAAVAAGAFVVDGALYAASRFAQLASGHAEALDAVIAGDAFMVGAAAGGLRGCAVGVVEAAGDADLVFADGAVFAALRVFETLHAASRVRVADGGVTAAVRVAAATLDAAMVQAQTLAALRVLVALHTLPRIAIAMGGLRVRQALRVELTRRAAPKLRLANGKLRRAVQVLRAGDDGVVLGQASRSASEHDARD